MRKLIIGLVVLFMAGAAYGATSWDGGGDGSDWFDADNWDAGVPDAADAVTINGAYTVNVLATGGQAAQLSLNGGATLNVNMANDADTFDVRGNINLRGGSTLNWLGRGQSKNDASDLWAAMYSSDDGTPSSPRQRRFSR